MGKNPNLGREAQKKGREAELRVALFCHILGLESTSSSELDYGCKTDLLIEGVSVQVSVSPKSSREQKSLRNRGITPISAGMNITDEELQEQILDAMEESDQTPFPLS